MACRRPAPHAAEAAIPVGVDIAFPGYQSRRAHRRQAASRDLSNALARGNFRSPLPVGDRLDTDIAGANSAGLPSLLVLSGVTTAAEALAALPVNRPTFVAADLSGINADSVSLRVEGLDVS